MNKAIESAVILIAGVWLSWIANIIEVSHRLPWFTSAVIATLGIVWFFHFLYHILNWIAEEEESEEDK